MVNNRKLYLENKNSHPFEVAVFRNIGLFTVVSMLKKVKKYLSVSNMDKK